MLFVRIENKPGYEQPFKLNAYDLKDFIAPLLTTFDGEVTVRITDEKREAENDGE